MNRRRKAVAAATALQDTSRIFIHGSEPKAHILPENHSPSNRLQPMYSTGKLEKISRPFATELPNRGVVVYPIRLLEPHY
jgi:hypothetical protein